MTTPQNKDWEKEFDEKFGLQIHNLALWHGRELAGLRGEPREKYDSDAEWKVNNLKSFISSLLTSQKASLIEEIEKMRVVGHDDEFRDRHAAIDYIQALLRGESK